MASKTTEDLLLEMALSRGYLLASDLSPLPGSADADTGSPSTRLDSQFGPRVQSLIQRGCISVTIVEQLTTELKRTEVALTISQAAPPTVSTSASSVFPVSNWEKYQFLSMLGQGGMGVVFKARDRKLGRIVALKFLTGSDAIQTQRFLQEARAQAQLDHPNICKIFETGEVQGKPYIAMHFVDGLSLDIARQSLSLSEKVRLLRESAEAVHVAHCHDVIHRDIKPSNIMVEQTLDGGTRAVLMDFGLARTAGHALTMTGEVLGTPAYMSPEQARGDTHNMDGRTDVYSLGSTLFEVLAGTPPFDDDSVYDLLIKLNEQEAPLLRSRDPSIPEALEIIVAKCLHKDPARRYLTAQALADDLGLFLFEKRISARKESLWSRLLYRAKRNKPVTALGLGLVGSLIVLASYGTWSRIHTQRAQDAARREAQAQAALAERLGQEIKDMEWLLRSARQLPIHDLRPEKEIIRKRMVALKSNLGTHGDSGQALAHYALGRGHLALHEYPQALAELHLAIEKGNRRGEVYYALGVVLGKHYEQAMADARLSGGGPWAESQLKEISPKYLEPAIAALLRSRNLNIDAPSYLEALLAFYQGKNDEALHYAKVALQQAPWLYEAAALAGKVNHERALKSRESGQDAAADAQFSEAAAQYELAASIGRSDAEVYEGLAEVRIRQSETQYMRGKLPGKLMAQAHWASDQITAVDSESIDGLLKKLDAYGLSIPGAQTGAARDEVLAHSIPLNREILRRQPGHPYASEGLCNLLMVVANRAIEKGDNPEAALQEAITVLEPVLLKHPKFLWGRNDLALAYRLKSQLMGMRDPTEAKRILTQKVVAAYLENNQLDPNYWHSQANILDALGYFAALPLTVEEELQIIKQSEGQFSDCMKLHPNQMQCFNNYAILGALLAWQAFLQGRDPEPMLMQARTNFGVLQQRGATFLDAQQHLALTHLVDALHRVRNSQSPAPALRLLQDTLDSCLRTDAEDPMCLSLRIRKQWLEADLQVQRATPHLLRTLADAEALTKRSPRFPNAWWVLMETHLRLARLLRSQPRQWEIHVKAGLDTAEKLLELSPAHVIGVVTKGNLCLLRAEREKDPDARIRWAQEASTTFEKARSLAPRYSPIFQDQQSRAQALLTH